MTSKALALVAPIEVRSHQAVPVMKLTLALKQSYGRTLAYPACETSTIFADMLGAKTLTRQNIKSIKALGYQIETTSNANLEDVQ